MARSLVGLPEVTSWRVAAMRIENDYINDWNQTANMKPTVNPRPEKMNKRIMPSLSCQKLLATRLNLGIYENQHFLMHVE
uniref:Uncharacterized protein n=1 Tax=Oryza rufipogon TaxID=4529 RepID=A0A0E0MRQ4_ORYRU